MTIKLWRTTSIESKETSNSNKSLSWEAQRLAKIQPKLYHKKKLVNTHFGNAHWKRIVKCSRAAFFRHPLNGYEAITNNNHIVSFINDQRSNRVLFLSCITCVSQLTNEANYNKRIIFHLWLLSIACECMCVTQTNKQTNKNLPTHYMWTIPN